MSEYLARKARPKKRPPPRKRSTKAKQTVGPGRPKHEPARQTRALVIRRVATGASRALIAREIGITIPTLALHYREELRDGVYLFRKELIDLLHGQALEGKTTAVKALMAATVAPTPQAQGSPEQGVSAQSLRLGKKEQAKVHAEAANTGRFATPPAPGAKPH